MLSYNEKYRYPKQRRVAAAGVERNRRAKVLGYVGDV
jgi:hypothetical protein